jgi:hypothetical protein
MEKHSWIGQVLVDIYIERHGDEAYVSCHDAEYVFRVQVERFGVAL